MFVAKITVSSFFFFGVDGGEQFSHEVHILDGNGFASKFSVLINILTLTV